MARGAVNFIHQIEEAIIRIKPTILLAALLVFLSFDSIGQERLHDLISVAGDDYKAGRIQMSWTIGDNVVETFERGDQKLTQGFLQSYPLNTSRIVSSRSVEIDVYPNPAYRSVQIDLRDLRGTLDLRVSDPAGKVVTWQQVLGEQVFSLDLTGHLAGIYLLSIEERETGEFYIFKIVKTN